MAKKPTYVFDLNAFSLKLNAESDRACAVLGAALLDAKLEELFRRRLHCFQDELLESARPIGTFSARISLACALSWVSDDVRGDLDVIRSIRNEFAHNYDHDLGFADQSISNKCSNLKITQAFLEGYGIAATAPNSNTSAEIFYGIQTKFKAPRWRYQIAVEFIAQYLDDIPAHSVEYSGANLAEDVRKLSANTRFRMSATGTVGPASKRRAD